MKYKSINLQEKFGLFSEHWAPKVIAEMNGYRPKVRRNFCDPTFADPKKCLTLDCAPECSLFERSQSHADRHGWEEGRSQR